MVGTSMSSLLLPQVTDQLSTSYDTYPRFADNAWCFAVGTTSRTKGPPRTPWEGLVPLALTFPSDPIGRRPSHTHTYFIADHRDVWGAGAWGGNMWGSGSHLNPFSTLQSQRQCPLNPNSTLISTMLLTPRNSRGLKRAKLLLSLVSPCWQKNLIGGSARGIGQGVALQLAKAGANIATFDILDPTETVELVRKEGVEAKGWRLDASPANEAGFNKAIDEVEAWHQIDILVNVAGIVRARFVVGRLC